MSTVYQTQEERSNAWKRVGAVQFGKWSVTNDTNNASGDAFGRLRVSEPFALLGLKQLYDGNPLFYDDAEVSGSGTSSIHNADEASSTLSVSNATAGVRVKQSKVRGVYQPGKGFLFICTFSNLHSATGITKRAGYYDDRNGLFVDHSDGSAKVVRRTYTSGSAVDNAVAQAEWNVDPMDGTGPSEITIDFTKTQILVIDFEWLGVGRVRIGWNIDGVTYYCHEFLNANNLDVVYMSNPNLPIRYEIRNDGNGGSDSFDAICASLISEGGTDDVEKSTYISRDGTAQTLANEDLYTPLVSVRLKAAQVSTRVNPLDVDIFFTSAENYQWKLFLNPSVAGTDNAAWVGVSNSSVEYDISRDNTNTVSGGYVVAGGYGASTNQVKSSIGRRIKNFLTLGVSADGTLDEYVLAVANIDGNGGTAYGGLTLGEYF